MKKYPKTPGITPLCSISSFRSARGLTVLDVERVVETPAQRRPFIPQPVYSRTYLGPGGSQDVMPMWFREVENLGRLVHKPEKSAGMKWNEYDPE